MPLILVLTLAALTSLPACGRSEPLFANFAYRVEGDRVEVPGTDVVLPPPSRCYYYIADNGYYACVARQDSESMDLYVSGQRGLQTDFGNVVIGAEGYFRHSPDRDSDDSHPVLRLGTMFPQGRAGVYVDCISYDERRIYAVRDGAEATYDYALNVVGGRHGRECTVQR